MATVTYSHSRSITCEQFIDVLNRSSLGKRRPVANRERIASMLEHSNLLCTAWSGDVLIGIARSVTDFSYCCYMSDLAVDAAHQRKGVGARLILATQERLDPRCMIVLLAAPQAEGYYPKIGMTQHRSAWILPAAPYLRREANQPSGSPASAGISQNGLAADRDQR
jgi:GNAT superfamily N-acetyltransferase